MNLVLAWSVVAFCLGAAAFVTRRALRLRDAGTANRTVGTGFGIVVLGAVLTMSMIVEGITRVGAITDPATKSRVLDAWLARFAMPGYVVLALGVGLACVGVWLRMTARGAKR